MSGRPFSFAARFAPSGLLACILSGLFFSACGGQGLSAATPAQELAEMPIAERGLRQALVGKSIDGMDIPALRGPTIALFFASWCGPCRYELELLGQLRQQGLDFDVIGFSAYEDFRDYSDLQRLREFLKVHAPWLKTLVHADAKLRKSFGEVPKIPTLFVFNAQGEVVKEFRREKRRSLPTKAELIKAIEAAR